MALEVLASVFKLPTAILERLKCFPTSVHASKRTYTPILEAVQLRYTCKNRAPPPDLPRPLEQPGGWVRDLRRGFCKKREKLR